ncbi:MAG: ABC transporter substrate-binding protein [Deltaproteobacteria bacterium]|nr:ABC transporter substrate-binding protein [Deltaproteobacteria bacterium]
MLEKWASGILALLLLIIAPGRSLALDKMRVGVSSVSALHGALWVASEKGLFKKHGIEAEVIVIGGASAGGMSALIAGDVQFLSGSGEAVINATLRGADIVMVASSLNKGVQRLVAQPLLKNIHDLAGKRIGVTRFGTASHLVLQMMLRRSGIAPDKIQVLQVGSSPAMLASLDKGGIDAAVLTMPSIFVAEERGYRILADLADMDIYYLNTMIDATRRYLRGNRDQSTRFLKGFVEGIAYFKMNKKESVEVLRKKLRTDPGREKYLELSYDLLASKFYDQVPYPSLKGVETVLGFLAKDNPKAREADPNAFIDNSIIKELDESGFIRKLYEK